MMPFLPAFSHLAGVSKGVYVDDLLQIISDNVRIEGRGEVGLHRDLIRELLFKITNN